MGTVPVWSHSVFALLGAVAAVAMSWHLARVRGRATPEFIWVVSGGLVGGALLAKFGLAGRYILDANTPTLMGFLQYGGRSLLGGLAGAYAGVVLTKRLVGYRGHTGDLLVPGVALGIAIGRIGCHLAEVPGTATSLPWGVTAPATGLLSACVTCRMGFAMHPSFLYESLFLLLAAWLLYAPARHGTYPLAWMGEGDLFKLFLLAYALFRFFVEFVRGNPVMAWGLSGSQLTVLVAGTWLAWRLARAWRAGTMRVA
jgi:prolipoprotein diacylglyceryltransferase